MLNTATNLTYMKLSNKRLILNIVKKKPLSRAELARTTGLTRASVTLLVEEFVKEGILIETGTAEADFGRKPMLLDLNPDCYYAVGVSIARDGCNIGIINFKGVLLYKRRVNLFANHSVYKNINIITENIKEIIMSSALPYERFLGIGVNTPGPVDIKNGTILNPPNFNIWHNVNIAEEFNKALNMDVYLENNSTSLALAEKNYGNGTGFHSFMLLVVDTGIGAGIIINDIIYRGVMGFGSEAGHMSVYLNGKPCNCGNRGCLELYASIPAILEYINQYDENISSWKEIVDKALSGNKLCMDTIDREAFYLSAGIVNVLNLLELEAVILTGNISYKHDLLIDKIRKNVECTAITRHIHKSNILNSSILENSEVISSASVVIEKFFKGELQKK